jgi:putative redox protein
MAGMDFEASNPVGASVSLGGPDSTELRPSELVLAGLAGCTGMDAISIMAKKRLDVTRYEVTAVGQQRDEHPRIFTQIVVTHVVVGVTLDDASVKRAIELSARKYCVVGANLATGDTTINHRLRMLDENGERTCDCLTIGPRGAGLAPVGEA